MGLLGENPVGLQIQMFYRPFSQVLVLIFKVPAVRYKPFTPQEEALGSEFPPVCGLLYLSLSYLLQCGFPIVCLI